MADSPKPTPSAITPVHELLILLLIAGAAYISINVTPININTVASGDLFTALWSIVSGKVGGTTWVWSTATWIRDLMTVMSVIFFAGIVWVALRSREVHHKEHELYKHIPVEEKVEEGKVIQWKVVLEHAASKNPVEWKIAILEADNMLDELLDEQGYRGDTVADKLKAMSPSRVTCYNELWEAHKLRNQIAHGGAIDMELSQKMVRDAIAAFEQAFRELGYI